MVRKWYFYRGTNNISRSCYDYIFIWKECTDRTVEKGLKRVKNQRQGIGISMAEMKHKPEINSTVVKWRGGSWSGEWLKSWITALHECLDMQYTKMRNLGSLLVSSFGNWIHGRVIFRGIE